MKNDIWGGCAYTVSLITLDHCNLESQIHILESGGIDLLHVDILDGHFSPSMPLGLETVRQLRQKTDLAFDCHIMTDPQEYFIDELLDIGVQPVRRGRALRRRLCLCSRAAGAHKQQGGDR